MPLEQRMREHFLLQIFSRAFTIKEAALIILISRLVTNLSVRDHSKVIASVNLREEKLVFVDKADKLKVCASLGMRFCCCFWLEAMVKRMCKRKLWGRIRMSTERRAERQATMKYMKGSTLNQAQKITLLNIWSDASGDRLELG